MPATPLAAPNASAAGILSRHAEPTVVAKSGIGTNVPDLAEPRGPLGWADAPGPGMTGANWLDVCLYCDGDGVLMQLEMINNRSCYELYIDTGYAESTGVYVEVAVPSRLRRKGGDGGGGSEERKHSGIGTF